MFGFGSIPAPTSATVVFSFTIWFGPTLAMGRELMTGFIVEAILWLNGTIGNPPKNAGDDRAYGMFIDSDSNSKTGWQGIEYQVEVNGDKGVWSRTVQEWSPTGETRILSNISNYDNFSRPDKRYAVLDVDLEKYLLSPHRYKVLFYAEERRGSPIPIFDFSNWITVPPPNFTVSISPNPVVIRQGENGFANLLINSTNGGEPQVNLRSVSNGSIKVNFDPPRLYIQPYGIAASRLFIKPNINKTGEYPIQVILDSTFIPEGFENGKPVLINMPQTSHFSFGLPDLSKAVQNTVEQSNLIVKLENPLLLTEKLKNWISDWFNPFSAVITPIVSTITGILGWKIGSSGSKQNNNKSNNDNLKDDKKTHS